MVMAGVKERICKDRVYIKKHILQTQVLRVYLFVFDSYLIF